MAAGWMIGVLVDLPDGEGTVRHYYAVGQADQARAEWAAVDRAMTLGGVATSPSRGVEPVEAAFELSSRTLRAFGLKPGEVKPLGPRWPRRWLASEGTAEGEKSREERP